MIIQLQQPLTHVVKHYEYLFQSINQNYPGVKLIMKPLDIMVYQYVEL